MMTIKPRVNKNEKEFRMMTEEIIRYYRKTGEFDYWTVQSIWNWDYYKTKRVYRAITNN